MSGTKHDQDKVRLDLLPFEALNEVGQILTFGANKYGDHNWYKGLSYSRLTGAILRHLFAFMRGEDLDPESRRSHIAHMVCSGLFLLTFILEGRKELDDRQKKKDPRFRGTSYEL